MNIKYLSLLILLPSVILASSGGGEGSTDIIPRTINFIIFASLLYYLIANPIRDYFVGRTDSIANKLEDIQRKLKESKEAKESAKRSVEDAKINATSIIETAKKEAKMIKDKIAKDLEIELHNMEKSFKERIEVEERKMSREVTKEILDKMFSDGSIKLDNDDLVNIIIKKAA